jgi:4-aminobutyrate aminotransferase/(S)-3-amino-2-methylpropionate transaminase
VARGIDRLDTGNPKIPNQMGNIRNRDAMIAMELVRECDASQPDAALTKSLADKGLILLSCGTRGNVIRFLPPLTIPMELVDEGMAIVADCITDCIALRSG